MLYKFELSIDRLKKKKYGGFDLYIKSSDLEETSFTSVDMK